MPVAPKPKGYHDVTPYLIVPGVLKLLEFLQKAFDAKVAERLTRPDGTVWHTEVKIGDSTVMMGEPTGRFGPMPSTLYLYVKNCDALYERAVNAGGVSVMEPMDQPTGERYGGIRDPSGNIWWGATHIKDVSPDQVRFSKTIARKATGLKSTSRGT